YACLGAILASYLRSGQALPLQSRVLVLVAANLAGWILIGIGLSLRSGETIGSIVKHNFNRPFYLAYGYFGLASLLTSYVLGGPRRHRDGFRRGKRRRHRSAPALPGRYSTRHLLRGAG